MFRVGFVLSYFAQPHLADKVKVIFRGHGKSGAESGEKGEGNEVWSKVPGVQ